MIHGSTAKAGTAVAQRRADPRMQDLTVRGADFAAVLALSTAIDDIVSTSLSVVVSGVAQHAGRRSPAGNPPTTIRFGVVKGRPSRTAEGVPARADRRIDGGAPSGGSPVRRWS